MAQLSKIEISVAQSTAAALTDSRRLEAVGRLIDRLVRPGEGDPLLALFAQTAAEACAAGLSEQVLDAELAAYNAQGRA